MDRTRSALLKAALAYAERGIPVTAGWPLDRRSISRWHHPQTHGLRLWQRSCARPGAHATGTQRILEPVAIRAVWDVPRTPNLMLSSSPAIALWQVPQALGPTGCGSSSNTDDRSGRP
jgi:hypothetical protein